MDINATIIGQVITFIILVLFSMKYIWPPLSAVLEERAKSVSDGIADSDKAKQMLLEADKYYHSQVDNARAACKKLLANAENSANRILENAEQRSDVLIKNIIGEAKANIAKEYLIANKELKKQFAKVVKHGVEKIVEKEINIDNHELIINQLLNSMNK